MASTEERLTAHDTGFWKRQPVPRRLGDEDLDDTVRVVTYVARGFAAMRGFDILVRIAKGLWR